MKSGDAGALGVVPGEVPYVRLPRKAEALFSRRAERLRELAVGHAAGDWLEALALIADAQARAVASMPALPALRELGGEQPLQVGRWRRDASWLGLLDGIIDEMKRAALPAPARAAVDALAKAGVTAREGWADALLDGGEHDLDLAGAPFLAAALQAYWTGSAAQLGADVGAAATEHSAAACPVCGSAPVAGIVLGDDKVRYLSCSLCASEWHRTRVQCVACGSGAAVSYCAIEGGAAGVKAETCGTCKTYLKLFYQEAVPGVEALADDAATLALDLLMGEAGYARFGVNLLVAP